VRALRASLWWTLIAVSALVVVFGLGDVAGGATVDPGISTGISGLSPAELEAESAAAYRMFDFATRNQGLALAAMGMFLIAILLVPYRHGSPWAWYAMWLFPLWTAGIVALYVAHGVAAGEAPPPPLVSGPILGGLWTAVLLIDRGRFFAAEPTAATNPREAAPWTGG
jgi:hypothetical protein